MIITSILNSLSSLSFTISRCNNHKNQHLYQCHRAGLTSGSIVREESFSISFSIASTKLGYSSLFIGNTQAKINGVTFLNHSIAFAVSGLAFGHSIFSGFQSVSHTFASLIDFNHVTTYQTDQFSIFAAETYFGEKYHTSIASIFLPVFKKCRVSPFFISPENTFT